MIQPPRVRAAAVRLRRAVLPFLLPLLCVGVAACNERPGDLREWRATDHDHTENPGSDQVQVDPQDAGTPAPPGLEDVTIVAWEQNCTQCHGRLGRGDGPRGPMLKARDLSDAAWQATVTDEQIAASIKLGKGLMPAFKLPDVTIAKLVKLVRMMNLAQLQAHANAAASASASASPSAGKTPKPSASAAPKAGAATPTPKASVAAPAPKASAN